MNITWYYKQDPDEKDTIFLKLDGLEVGYIFAFYGYGKPVTKWKWALQLDPTHNTVISQTFYDSRVEAQRSLVGEILFAKGAFIVPSKVVWVKKKKDLLNPQPTSVTLKWDGVPVGAVHARALGPFKWNGWLWVHNLDPDGLVSSASYYPHINEAKESLLSVVHMIKKGAPVNTEGQSLEVT
jgi:hypothetical protein